jgi:hypothetical protein
MTATKEPQNFNFFSLLTSTFTIRYLFYCWFVQCCIYSWGGINVPKTCIFLVVYIVSIDTYIHTPFRSPFLLLAKSCWCFRLYCLKRVSKSPFISFSLNNRPLPNFPLACLMLRTVQHIRHATHVT